LQLFHGAVFAADFADFAAHGNRNSGGLQITDHGGQLRRQCKVGPLLIFDSGLGQINQRGSINVDIIKSGFNRFPDQIFNRLRFFIRVRGKFFRAQLEVVTLEKNRTAPAGFHGCRRYRAGVFQRSLRRIIDFRTGNFKNNRSHTAILRRAKNRLRHIVGEPPDVNCRHGETADLFSAHRFVKSLNGRGVNT